jgi:hypothetical protein
LVVRIAASHPAMCQHRQRVMFGALSGRVKYKIQNSSIGAGFRTFLPENPHQCWRFIYFARCLRAMSFV